MTDLSGHVLLPQEDYRELMSSAWTPRDRATPIERVGSTVQTTLVLAAIAGALTAGSFGVAKAMDWFEEKTFQRKQREREYAKNAQ